MSKLADGEKKELKQVSSVFQVFVRRVTPAENVDIVATSLDGFQSTFIRN